MRAALLLILCSVVPCLFAEDGISFSIPGKQYNLKGGHAVIQTVKGRTQIMLAVRDADSKAQIAITAEIPANLTGPIELSSEDHPVSAVIVNANGIYSFVPHVTLARDDFMRYIKKEEVSTDETEDDPHDRPQDRLDVCRKELNQECQRQMEHHRRKRKKVRARYIQHGPTWINKTRSQRIASGDGVMREEKYKDTTFLLRLTPVFNGNKITGFTGSFAGVMVYNEGLSPAIKVPVANGWVELKVHDAR